MNIASASREALRQLVLVAGLSGMLIAQNVNYDKIDPKQITPEQREAILKQMATERREDAEHQRLLRYGLGVGVVTVGILFRRWMRSLFG